MTVGESEPSNAQRRAGRDCSRAAIGRDWFPRSARVRRQRWIDSSDEDTSIGVEEWRGIVPTMVALAHCSHAPPGDGGMIAGHKVGV